MCLQRFMFAFIIIEVATVMIFQTIIYGNFENEVTYLENEINNNSQKVIVTDDIENEAKRTIDETCSGKYEGTSDDELNEKFGNEDDLENESTIDNRSINYNAREKAGGLRLLGAYQGLTYYSQADSRWANTLYTSIGDKNQTMKSSGCGPTTAAMVVSSSKGAILPTTMAKLFVNNGYRTPANGTAWSAFPFVADYFGFNQYENTSNINIALDYLRKGYFVIVSCGNGLFTTNGHYILLVGIDGNTLSIYDSYMYNGKFNTPSRKGKVTVKGHTIYCSISNFKKYANYRTFWCYSNDRGSENKNEASNKPSSSNSSSNGSNNTTKKYKTGEYRTTANLHIRFGPSTKYRAKTYKQLTPNARKQNKRLGNYYYNGYKKGVKCTVYKIRGNWGLTNSGWICLDYCKFLG